MADIRPFAGIRFDPAQVKLGRVLCPPYDAVSPEQAKVFRKEKFNAIYLELPRGAGPVKYRNSARVWKRWNDSGLLLKDDAPSFYVCEQRFTVEGRVLKRVGFMAAMGVSPSAAKAVICHEKTLSKPKADRLNILKAVKANISPIFGIFPDPSGRVRRALSAVIGKKPDAQGPTTPSCDYRFWKLSDSHAIALIRRELKAKKILIADGHHRYSVSRAYYGLTRDRAADTVLIYLCPEEDKGLVVLPTHRVVSDPKLLDRAALFCKIARFKTRPECLRRLSASANPYAFGFFEKGYYLAEPRGPQGCRSGLCVEWLAKNLLKDVAPDLLAYTPDAAKAVEWAKQKKGAALFVKPLRVAQVRRAVAAVGLLPQKTTYFYPKIATGLVFKPLYR